MVLFSSSTWLLIVVCVNVVSAAKIDETEDSVKNSFMSLLKNIVNINEKRIHAMKHIDEENDFRLGSYLSKIHKVNDDSQEDEKDQNNYIGIIDMTRNLNLASRETYTQPTPVIEDDAKMVLLFNRLIFETININHKKKILTNYDKIIELISGYKSEPSILDIRNQTLKDSSEKMNNRIFRKNNDIIELPITYFDLIFKIIKLNDSYQKKMKEVRQNEDIIRKLQNIINILKNTHVIKDQNENTQRKIVNLNCDDETEEDTKCEDDKKKHNCCIFDGKIDVKHVKCEGKDASTKKPDNVGIVLNFDDGKEGEESQWTDWSYEFAEGEAFSSWKNKGDGKNARKSSRKSCGESAAKTCRSACSVAHKNVCTRYKCIRQAKQSFRKECKRTCTAAFVASKDSEERL